MHDPMTVAHEIKYPWRKYRPWTKEAKRIADRSGDHKYAWESMSEAERAERYQGFPDGYRESFVTVWHVDPERDGSDDSCGFSVPHLSPEQRQRLKSLAWNEARNPYFLRCASEEWTGTRHEAECLWRGLVLAVCRYAHIPMTFDGAAKKAAETIHDPDCCDSARGLCFKPGWHTNSKEDSQEDRERHFHGQACGIARWILRDRRPWWKHPRWHIHHWKIQIHPVQSFKRWAFSRCSTCGGGFKWGEAPCSGWGGEGPRWFRGEPGVWHSGCACPVAVPQPDKTATAGAGLE